MYTSFASEEASNASTRAGVYLSARSKGPKLPHKPASLADGLCEAPKTYTETRVGVGHRGELGADFTLTSARVLVLCAG